MPQQTHFQAETGCVFPYVLPTCMETYASQISSDYHSWQVLFKIFGSLACIACFMQLLRVFRLGGSAIQRGVYIFLVVSAGTFVVRGIDPSGYDDVVSPMIDSLIRSVCTAAIYSIAFYIVVIWTGLLNSIGSRTVKVSRQLALVAVLYSILTWIVLIAGSVVRTKKPATDDPHLSAIEFLLLFVLTLTGIVYMVYIGVALDRKIREADLPRDDNSGRNGIIRCIAWSRRQSKVMKIVYASSTIGLALAFYQLSVFLQGFQGIQRNPWFDYNLCVMNKQADCHAVYPFDLFSVFQMCGMSLIFWSFWTIPRTANDDDKILDSTLAEMGYSKEKKNTGRKSKGGRRSSLGYNDDDYEDMTPPSSRFSASWGSLMPSESGYEEAYDSKEKSPV